CHAFPWSRCAAPGYAALCSHSLNNSESHTRQVPPRLPCGSRFPKAEAASRQKGRAQAQARIPEKAHAPLNPTKVTHRLHLAESHPPDLPWCVQIALEGPAKTFDPRIRD